MSKPINAIVHPFWPLNCTHWGAQALRCLRDVEDPCRELEAAAALALARLEAAN